MPPRHPLTPILAAACLVLASCQGPPEIAGRVVPRGKVALPANAVLEVQVADVSRSDEAPVVVARRTYSPLGAAPWSFTLRVDSLRSLDSRHTYALQARVLVDGKPRLVSRRRTFVNPARLADTLEVTVEPVPRTVGAVIGGPARRAAGLWNPRGRPVTLPAPIPAPVASLAAGSPPDRARGAYSQPERSACPPCPVP
jgi:uncharacterized lipoprotein YbaY